MPGSRRRRGFFSGLLVLRAVLALLVVAVLAGVLAAGAALLLFDPNSQKPRIEAAIGQATGRVLALRGPVRLGFGVPPRLIADDLSISNPAGASRAQMATVERVEARVAIVPLLAGDVELADLTLVRPDVLLERDATGQANWLRAAAAPAPAAADSGGKPPPATGERARPRLAVRSIHIIDGKLGWLPRPGAAPVWASIPRLDAAANGPDGALRLAGTLLGAGRTFELSGELGPLAGLTDGGAVGPWPLRLTLRDKAARLELTGSIAQPMRGRGLALQVDASVGDFAGFEPFLPPGVPVPHDATAVLRVADGKESGRASLTGITLHLGRLPPGQPLPGVDISRADFSAPALDGPLHAELEGRADVGALKLVADAGSLAALLPGAEPPAPVPIEATLDAGAAHFSAKGTVAHPAALAGVELDASASVPDLAAFAPLLGRPLPKLAQVAFDGHLSGDLSGGGAIGVRKATLSLPQARIAGDVEVRPGARPDVRAHLTSPRLDLDALLAVLLAPPAAPPPAPAPAAAAPSGPPRLFPDTPIDVSALDRIDLDVDFHVDALRAGGAGYTQVAGTAKLRDGKLVLDPLAGTTPGGAAEARLSIDARAAVPGFALVLRAPSLQLAPLVAAFGASAPIGGSISVEADLQGVGRSPHAIAASLDGHLGVQSVDAEIDNRELISLLRLSRLPEVPLGSGGTTKLRCFALRLDASNGIATVGALVADLHRLVVTGGGALDLGQEQFALQLRPLLRVGGALGGIVVPVRVGGGFFDPKVTVGAGGKGGLPIAGPGASDPCGPALAAAAGAGVPALKPAAEAAVPALLKGAPKTALDVLKGLIK